MDSECTSRCIHIVELRVEARSAGLEESSDPMTGFSTDS
jgi:hypothetical protein